MPMPIQLHSWQIIDQCVQQSCELGGDTSGQWVNKGKEKDPF